MKHVVILGSTGSIGAHTLEVLARNPGTYTAFALAADQSVEPMVRDCLRFRPQFAVLRNQNRVPELREALRNAGIRETQVMGGTEALAEVVAHPQVDQVVAGIVGAAGLEPTLAAVRAGKTVLLANKECLVMAGALFMEETRQAGATLIPIDSEHNALFQILTPNKDHGVQRMQLTASGGPFRTWPLERLASVTPKEACAHPNWSMGPKISVDSATMMNKGLEIIEAYWLFAFSPEQIAVLVHPESIVHSLVEYIDGSVLAQLGNPDMRTPIAAALAHPERIPSGVEPLDLARIGTLHFEAPDFTRFPALQAAYRALEAGGTAPALLNGANEEAVHAFLRGELDFPGITQAITYVLDSIEPVPASDLATIYSADQEARQGVRDLIAT